MVYFESLDYSFIESKFEITSFEIIVCNRYEQRNQYPFIL